MTSFIEENSPEVAQALAEKMLKQGKIKSYKSVEKFLHHRGRQKINGQIQNYYRYRIECIE